MKLRARTIRLRTGDVKAVRIVPGKCSSRLFIYDEDTAVPLIQAALSVAERQAIRKALGSGK
jgi:hypothetical protein